MAPRGTVFLIDVGLAESGLDKLLQLVSRGFHPIAARRRQSHLFVTLDSPTSSQRIAEVIGPGVSVKTEDFVPLTEAPVGTDWIVRVVGPRPMLERSLGRLLQLTAQVSMEVGGADFVEMGIDGVEPAVLNLRLTVAGHTAFESRRIRFLDLAEKLGVGMLVQPLSLFRKRKGLACFDLDSTLVSEELIIEVARKAGKADEVARITQAAMLGQLDYKRSFIQRVGLLRGVREEELEEIWRGIRPTREVTRLLTELRMRGIRTAILSGAFTFFTDRARDRLGMDYSVGNDVEIKEGRLTGNVRGQIVDSGEKKNRMREIAEGLGLTLEEVVAIGDGANDIDIVRDAGTGIAFNKGGVVKIYASGVLPEGRLGDLLCLLDI